MATELPYDHKGVTPNDKAEYDVTVKEVMATSAGDAIPDVWGDLSDEGPNYRGLGWIRASVILCKIQIGLGILAMPSYFHTVGIVPGIILVVVIGLVVTWADWIVGWFKMNHPEVHTIADAGYIMWGKVGREIVGAANWLNLICIAGANLIGASTALNALSDHATCTVVFVVVCAAVALIFASIQTLGKVSWITWIGLICIMTSVLTLTVAAGVQKRPSAAPKTGPWDKDFRVVNNPGFVPAISVVVSIIFSFSGTPNYFPVVAEMKEPHKYFKAMYWSQVVTTVTFGLIGSLVYHFCGQYVSSPALGSAGPLFKKVCYGLALPGLLAGAILNTHIPAKYAFVRILRNSRHLTKNTMVHYLVWYGCILVNLIVSFLIAEAIPVFGDLLAFCGAFFSTPLCLTVEGFMYLHDTRSDPNRFKGMRNKLIHGGNALMIILSTFCAVAGTYTTVTTIKNSVASGNKSSPFSCADNS